MDDDGRQARPIKGSCKRGHARQSVGRVVDTLYQRAAQATPRSRRRTHLAPEGKRLRARNFLLFLLGRRYLSHGRGRREGCSGEISGEKPGGRTWGGGSGGNGGLRGGTYLGDFNFLFFSLAVT